MTFSISFFPLVTAEISIKSALTSVAKILERVVLPVPAGPQKIKLIGSLFSIIFRRIPFFPIRWD